MTNETYDLAIVGADVMGLSAAFIAARNRPRDRVVIFERDIVGAGASRFAPGIQINICRNERERQLINHSSKFWQGIYPHGLWPVGRDCDVFWLTPNPKELARLSSVGGTTPSTSSALRQRLSSLPHFFVPSDTAVELDRGSYSPVDRIVQDLAKGSRRPGSLCTNGHLLKGYGRDQAIFFFKPWIIENIWRDGPS